MILMPQIYHHHRVLIPNIIKHTNFQYELLLLSWYLQMLREHFRDSGEYLCGVVEKKKKEKREREIKIIQHTQTFSLYPNRFAGI